MATPPDFTTGQVLTAAQMNAVGLWLIKTQTLNAVSNDITDVFTSDYDSYRVVISNFSKATTTVRAINIRMLDGATPETAAEYDYVYNFAYPANLGGNAGFTNLTAWEITLCSTKSGQSIIIDFNSPQKAHPMSITFQCLNFQSDIGTYIIRQGGGGLDTNTTYEGFRIYTTTDALSGTVRVYGYNQ